MKFKVGDYITHDGIGIHRVIETIGDKYHLIVIKSNCSLKSLGTPCHPGEKFTSDPRKVNWQLHTLYNTPLAKVLRGEHDN